MQQTAPYPDALADVVAGFKYMPGWEFKLEDIDRGQGSAGLTLSIYATVPNSYDPDKLIQVHHPMIVPPAAYDRRTWRRWLLEQIMLVHLHEAMEFFQDGDERPYAPNHGPGRNPYVVHELGTVEDAETSFLGVRDEGSRGQGM